LKPCIQLASEVRNSIAHRSGYIDYLPNNNCSLYTRLQNKDIELKRDVSGQQDAQIIITKEFLNNSINIFRALISLIGRLERDFVTPKHGLPSQDKTE
jgi:hypothetical protein